MVLTSRSGEPLVLEGVSATGQLQATPRAWPVQVDVLFLPAALHQADRAGIRPAGNAQGLQRGVQPLLVRLRGFVAPADAGTLPQLRPKAATPCRQCGYG